LSLDNMWVPGVSWRGFNTTYCSSDLANREYCAMKKAAAAAATAK